MKNAVLIFSFLLGVFFFGTKVYGAAGVTGNDFLNYYPGARAYALGENNFADTSNGFALYYNPASANFLKGRYLSLQHTEWFAGIRYEYLSYYMPRLKLGQREYRDIGFSYMLVYLSAQHTEINMDYYLNKGDINPALILGRYYATFHQFILSKGFEYQGVNLGLNIKLLYSRIASYSSTGFALDVGALWDTSKAREIIKMRDRWKKIVIPDKTSVILRNLGPRTYFLSERASDPLPAEAILALSNAFFKDKLFYTFNLRYRVYYGIILGMGAEYRLFKVLDLRMGVRHRFYENRIKWYEDINAGLGLHIGITEHATFHLDYALKSFGSLGLTHYISTYLKF